MLSWRAFTREAARLPSSMRPSMRLRRAEMIAISLPEKKPLPSSSTKIEAAMKRGSDMALERHVTKGSAPAAALLPPGASDSVTACAALEAADARAERGGSLGQRRDLRRHRHRDRPGRVRGRRPRRPDGAQDGGRRARPGGVRRHLPPAGLHPHESAPPHRGPLRGLQEPQGVRDRGRERGPRLPRRHVPQGPHRPAPEQGHRDLPLQEAQDRPLQGPGPPGGLEGGGGEGRRRRDEDRHEERHPRHRIAPEVAPRHHPGRQDDHHLRRDPAAQGDPEEPHRHRRRSGAVAAARAPVAAVRLVRP